VEGEWLPPQAPGSNPPPPVPQGTPQARPPFEPVQDPAPQQTPPTAGPPNNEAVAAMTCALAGGALLYFSSGFSSVVSLILGVIAVTYAGTAKRNIADGKTTQHADLATAATVAGWITIGVSTVATIVWTLVIVVA
jgi:hypothetical protein